MSARVRIVDVGGLRGEHEFVFERGRLSIIEGSNSGGKSSVIQALAAVLSVPGDCDLGSFFGDEAVRLGVRTDPSNTQEGFVHVLAKKGRVELEFDEKRLEYVVDARGICEQCPSGDPRFLIAGVLSNRCKVIRQLRGQDNFEPDDFRWAVSELSLAKRYDEVLELLNNGRDEAREQFEVAKIKANEFKQLSKERDRLEKTMQPLEASMRQLQDKYASAKQTLKRLTGLREKENKTRTDIAHLSADIETERRALEQENREREKKQKQLARVRAEITEIRITELESELKKDETEIEAEARDLSSKRDSLDGVLNLYVVAEASMGQAGGKCPLCGKGKLTLEEVQKTLQDLRRQKEDYTSRISKLRMGIQQRRFDLDTKKTERSKLQEDADVLSQELKQLGKGKAFVGSREDDLKARKAELERIEHDIQELSTFDDEKVQRDYTEKDTQYRQVFEKLAVVKERLYGCNVIIRKVTLAPDLAMEIAGKWLGIYDSLIDFTRNVAEDQRVKASGQFNTAIKELLNRLGFKEFRTVMLNKEHRLYVERFDEKRKDYVFQQVRTLSTSEQMSIALILQLALKETYLPDVPFFLMDDIMEDFDETRRLEVVEYLRSKAQNKDMYIICTKLAETKRGLSVKLEGA